MSETAMQPQGAYYEFRAAIDAMAEKLGGDDFAKAAAEMVFSERLAQTYRDCNERRHSILHVPHGAEWTQASEEDFEEAVRRATVQFTLPLADNFTARVTGRKFTIAWTSFSMYRMVNDNPQYGIGLAYTTGLTLHITDAGDLLAGANRRAVRSRSRRYKSLDAIIKAFGSLANWEFKS